MSARYRSVRPLFQYGEFYFFLGGWGSVRSESGGGRIDILAALRGNLEGKRASNEKN